MENKHIDLFGIESLDSTLMYPWASPEAAVESVMDEFEMNDELLESYEMGVESYQYGITAYDYFEEGIEGLWEGTKTRVKNAWEWIKNLFKKFWAWITGSNKSAEKDAKEIKTSIEALKAGIKSNFEANKGCWVPNKEGMQLCNELFKDGSAFRSVLALTEKGMKLIAEAKDLDKMSEDFKVLHVEMNKIQLNGKNGNVQGLQSEIQTLHSSVKPEFITTSESDAIAILESYKKHVDFVINLHKAMATLIKNATSNIEKLISTATDAQKAEMKEEIGLNASTPMSHKDFVKAVTTLYSASLNALQILYRAMVLTLKKVLVICKVRNNRKQGSSVK